MTASPAELASPLEHGSAEHGAGSWLEWGGDGPPLHFAHANGFPPGTYRRMVEPLLECFRVVSMGARPLWSDNPPESLRDWSELGADLGDELRRRGLRGVIGVGHSLGAAMSLLAAADDPGLFSAVVAIDPLVLTGALAAFWGLVKRLGLGRRIGLVRGALARRDEWPDRETARASYACKPIFRGWQDEVLDDYLEAGLVPDGGGALRLRYPPAWEARIFEIAPHNLWPALCRLRVPCLLVQGERSDTLRDAARERFAREVPGARCVVVEGASHFVPMERPRELARLIDEFVKGVTSGS